MAELLKNFFSPALVRRLAGDLTRVHPPFPSRLFIRQASAGLEKLDRPGAKELRDALGDLGDAAAHQKDVEAFFAACQARPKAGMLSDILRYNAHLKAALKSHQIDTPDGRLGILEFSETLPVDDLPDAKKRFDPKTCELVAP